MKKLISLIILILLVTRLVGCSLNPLNTITNTEEELEKRIEESDDAFIKRLKEGM